jgi:hypothetical protein
VLRAVRAVGYAALLVLSACGARTGLLAPETFDGGDAAPDGPPRIHGCADGQREGFLDAVKYPAIAGCSGGWSVPGVMPFNPGTAPACPTFTTHDTVHPACNRGGGDDGANPKGAGCCVADLCEAGWHVCTSAADVTSHSPTGCKGATSANAPPLFFVTRQSSNGCGACATGGRTDSDCNSETCSSGCAQTPRTSNDVFGCGNLGASTPILDCGPIDRFSNNLCNDVGSNWTCNDDGTGFCEAYAILHNGSAFGGALCCRD